MAHRAQSSVPMLPCALTRSRPHQRAPTWAPSRTRAPPRPPPLPPAQLDLRDLNAIKRDKPLSVEDYTFRVSTPSGGVTLDPGSREAFQKWQEGLMMCVSAPSPMK